MCNTCQSDKFNYMFDIPEILKEVARKYLAHKYKVYITLRHEVFPILSLCRFSCMSE
jgi:hypothetical protein